MDTAIVIKDLRIYARHGVMPQEQLTGDYFTINLRLSIDFSAAMKSDSLEDTLDYSAAVETVRKEMGIPSKLLEHAGRRICQALFDKFANVKSISSSFFSKISTASSLTILQRILVSSIIIWASSKSSVLFAISKSSS